MGRLSTIPELLKYIGEKHSNPRALNSQDSQGRWHSESTESYLQKVRWLALALNKRGLKRGDRVGILSKPCPGWTIADLATMVAGGINVPLFGNQSPENLAFELESTRPQIIFVAGEAEWVKCTRFRHLFQMVVSLERECPDETATPLSLLLKEGEAIEAAHPELWESLQNACQPHDIASIIFTSGSMGRPKGVQLSQFNFVNMLYYDPFKWDAQHDRYLSFLPLAHIFARMLNFILLKSGMSIYYLDDPKAFVQASRSVRPTILVLVPRLLERLLNRLTEKLKTSGYLLSRIGAWALRIAENEEETWWLRCQRWIADKLVYNSIRKAFGGHVRLIISGGAKLNAHLARCFIHMGFPIYEGWGMTEACPISCNLYGARKIGTVGKALDYMEVRVGDHNELLARGCVVMEGYYQNTVDADRVVDADGWLHTGDQGSIDSEGYITIRGRVKELFKTSTGEYVAPLPIEHELAKLDLVDHAVVIAEGRPYCTCLLFPDFEALEALKQRQGMSDLSDEEFLELPEVRERIEEHIREMNRHLNHWEEVHDYSFVPDFLTVDEGLLTPTLKVRRDVVAEKYKAMIASMYSRGGRI